MRNTNSRWYRMVCWLTRTPSPSLWRCFTLREAWTGWIER